MEISDIGAERLAALEAVAAERGVSVEALVLSFVDEGLARERAARDRKGRVDAAGSEVEGQYSHGTSLDRFTKD